jgi:hypothetical protein
MRIFVRLTLAVALAAVLAGCGLSKPNGSEYLGKWNATETGSLGFVVTCPLDISRNGASFLITVEGPEQGDMCKVYQGIYTLTPEGNLTNGNVVFSFDKEANRIAVSNVGPVQFLKKR